MVDAREHVPGRPLPEVVTFPALVDIASCDDYAEELEDAFRRTRAAVIADLSATVFCDASAIRRLVLAEKRAAAAGYELRVVVPSPDMRRVLHMSGVGQMLTVYADMASALNWALHPRVCGQIRPGPQISCAISRR